MSMFKIEFDTDNAAFAESGEYEVVRILRAVASRIEESGSLSGVVKDVNGNTVGEFKGDIPFHVE